MDALLSGAAVLNDLTQYLSDTRALAREEWSFNAIIVVPLVACLLDVLFNLFKRAALNALLIVTSFPP